MEEGRWNPSVLMHNFLSKGTRVKRRIEFVSWGKVLPPPSVLWSVWKMFRRSVLFVEKCTSRKMFRRRPCIGLV